jgi:hypothetical protein
MPTPKIIQQRLAQLEEQLALEYEKLSEFRQELAMSIGEAKTVLKLRISRELIPTIRRYETEYVGLVSQIINNEEAKDMEDKGEPSATAAVQLLAQAITQAQAAIKESISSANNASASALSAPDRSQEILERLCDIQQTLNDTSKSATAKLKVALPILPLLVSYELEIDTESFLTNAWQKIKGLFRAPN